MKIVPITQDEAQRIVSILRAVQLNLGAITTLAKAENSQSAVDEYLLSTEFAGTLESAITDTECAIWSVGVIEDELRSEADEKRLREMMGEDE